MCPRYLLWEGETHLQTLEGGRASGYWSVLVPDPPRPLTTDASNESMEQADRADGNPCKLNASNEV